MLQLCAHRKATKLSERHIRGCAVLADRCHSHWDMLCLAHFPVINLRLTLISGRVGSQQPVLVAFRVDDEDRLKPVAHSWYQVDCNAPTCRTPVLSCTEHHAALRSPTVSLPTSRVPAIEVFTTGMWSASSASKTLHAEWDGVTCVHTKMPRNGAHHEYTTQRHNSACLQPGMPADTVSRVRETTTSTEGCTCKSSPSRPEPQGSMRWSALQTPQHRCCFQIGSESPCWATGRR